MKNPQMTIFKFYSKLINKVKFTRNIHFRPQKDKA